MKDIKIIVRTEKQKKTETLTKYFYDNYDKPIFLITKDETNNNYLARDFLINLNFHSSHLGPLCLTKCPIYFWENCYINPNMVYLDLSYLDKFYRKEELGKCYIDLKAFIITPIDYLINHALKINNIQMDINNNLVYKRFLNPSFNYKYEDFLKTDSDFICKNIYENFYKPILNQMDFHLFDEVSFNDLDEFTRWDRPFGKECFFSLKLFKISLNYMKKFFIIKDFNYILNNFNTGIIEMDNLVLDNSLNFYYLIKRSINEIKCNKELIFSLEDFNQDINYEHYYKELNLDNVNKYNLAINLNKNQNIPYLNNEKVSYAYDEANDFVIKINHTDKKYTIPNLIFQHNHNSGLSTFLGKMKNKDKYYMAISPRIYDYPYIENSGTNIESIISTETYNTHVNFIITSIKNNYYLLLLDNKFIINNKTLKEYYIDYLNINKFIVASLEQARAIKEINKDLTVIGKLDNLNDDEVMDFYKSSGNYFDGFILNSKSQINEKQIHLFGVCVNLDKEIFEDVYTEWIDKTDNFYIQYGKEKSFMYDVEKMILRTHEAIETYLLI